MTFDQNQIFVEFSFWASLVDGNVQLGDITSRIGSNFATNVWVVLKNVT